MSNTENQPVTAGQIANSVADYGIANANRCQWHCQFSGNGSQPVEKQQKRVAYTTQSTNRVCPSSEYFGMLRRFRNGGSGSVSV